MFPLSRLLDRPNRLPSPPRTVRRLLLRHAARRYAAHRWPVLPGAPLRSDRFDCGEPGCRTITCHPARADWEITASDDHKRVATWWGRADHGVLLATGHAFDVLEIAGGAGRQVAREVPGPVAVAAPHRWMFFVRTGVALHPDLAGTPSVVLHGRGSWVPAPPTPLAEGPVHWEVPPARCDWQPADPAVVQRAARRVLRFDHGLRQVWWHLNRSTVPTTE